MSSHSSDVESSNHQIEKTLPPTETDQNIPPPTSVNALPSPFGRYTIVRQLGEGGMGSVYLAHDSLLDRRVALKVPHPNIVNSPQALERFYREARAAAQLDHPGICRIHDVGSFHDRPYMTMTFVEGEPLAAHMASYRSRPREAVALLRQVALTVAEAHARGVVHRDLKPANIMMDRRGQPVIMDFGLARVQATPEAGQTSPGIIMGTPAYMSPEQASGDPSAIGPASDVYSLGVILYELLTGRTPFTGEFLQLLVQVASDPPPPPSLHQPGIDPVLERLCLKALSKDPQERFAGAAPFAAALDDYLAGRNIAELEEVDTSPTRRAVALALRELRARGWEQGSGHLESVIRGVSGLPGRAAAILFGWLSGNDEAEARVREFFADSGQLDELAVWRQVGTGYHHLRTHHPEAVWAVGESIVTLSGSRSTDPTLAAELAHLRAAALIDRGHWQQAASCLHQALEQIGGDHPLAVRLLTALGRVEAGKCHYHASCEFLQQALLRAESHQDAPGLIEAAEQLGSVQIDWDHPDQAEDVLNTGCRLAQKRRDTVAEARLVYQLGRAVYRRGELAATEGKRAAADKRFRQAGDYFAWAIRAFEGQNEPVWQALACREAAQVHLLSGDHERASALLDRAHELLEPTGNVAAQAAVARTRVGLLVASNHREKALALLRQARATYESLHRDLDATRTQFELARALAASEVPQRMVVRAYQEALSRAEECRHDGLVRVIDQELESLDEEAYWRQSFERVRNTLAAQFSSALNDGSGEVVSVVSLEFADFDAFCRGQEPDAVLQTLNQLLAEFETVVRRHRGHVTSYLGGGLTVLVREAGHAERAVQIALDLRYVVAEFNRPRGPLGLLLLPVRVGVATGPAFLGNLGTYRYMCFMPVGPVVNLAASLARQADPAAPCISQETQEQVRDRFTFRPGSPRQIEVTAMGSRKVWDVAGTARLVTRGGGGSSRRSRRGEPR